MASRNTRPSVTVSCSSQLDRSVPPLKLLKRRLRLQILAISLHWMLPTAPLPSYFLKLLNSGNLYQLISKRQIILLPGGPPLFIRISEQIKLIYERNCYIWHLWWLLQPHNHASYESEERPVGVYSQIKYFLCNRIIGIAISRACEKCESTS